MKKYTSALQLVLVLLLTSAAFGQTTPPTNDLYAHWRFDETSGTTANDASVNSDALGNSIKRTGTLGSHPTTATLPVWLASGWANGCIGIYPEGGTSFVSVPSVTWTPTDFTVSFWMNPYQLTGGEWGQVITATGNFWGKFTFMLSPVVDGSTRQGMIMVGTDAATALVLPAGTVEANKWQHYTFTFDADPDNNPNTNPGKGEGKFYENGRLLASRADMAVSQTWAGFSIGIADPRGRLNSRIRRDAALQPGPFCCRSGGPCR